jgi:uncharacterized protein
MLVLVEVASFGVDAETQEPLLVLKACDSKRTLSFPIGPGEAAAIAVESLKVTPERPLTADVATALMDTLGAVLSRVEIHERREQILLARLHVAVGNGVHVIDCRPCDAVALALRSKAPIFAEDALFDKKENDKSHSDEQRLRETIAGTDTLEFGRYYLE